MNAITTNWLADEALGIETREVDEELHVRVLNQEGGYRVNHALGTAYGSHEWPRRDKKFDCYIIDPAHRLAFALALAQIVGGEAVKS